MHIQKLHIFPKRYLNKHFSLAVFALAALLYTASCGSAPSSNNGTETTPPAVSFAPDEKELTAAVTPSTPPASSVPTLGIGSYSSEMATEKIREFLDSPHYGITLVSDDLTIDSDNYYTFLISLRGSAIEPLILVNKLSGELKCIMQDNTIAEIAAHPLYHEADTALISWNGTYIILDEEGTLRNYIILAQVDDEHFKFTAYSYLDNQVEELSGVAKISEREASFISGSGTKLFFSWSGANLVLEHSHQKGMGSLTGIYSYTENQDANVVNVSPQEAVDRLSRMDAKAAGLSGSMQDYFFYVQDDITIMSDRLCYNVSVYSNEENRLFYQEQLFVTLDGKTVYRQEKTSGDMHIFSLQ